MEQLNEHELMKMRRSRRMMNEWSNSVKMRSKSEQLIEIGDHRKITKIVLKGIG